MEDTAGNPLHVGDLVVSTFGGKPQLHLFQIISFTAQKIRVANATGHLLPSASGRFVQLDIGQDTLKFPNEVYKFFPQEK